MRNLGFHFELSPQQSFLNCTRLGMWKHKLRMAKSTHVVMDFQDTVWYMSAVYFKTPDVQSFFLNLSTLSTASDLLKLLPLLLMVTGRLIATGKNWSVTTRPSVVNFSRLKVPSVQFRLMLLLGQLLLRGRMEWDQKGGERWLESSLRSRKTFGQAMMWENCFSDQEGSETPRRIVYCQVVK